MLLEWLFERKNPGAVGTVDVQAPESASRRPGFTIAHGLIGLGLIGGAVYFVFQARNPLVVLGGLVIYLLFSFYVHPRPNHDNIGLAGGLIDHPLRWSDDQNRMLLFLQLALFPGRFATTGVRDLLRLVVERRARPKLEKGVVWERKE